MVKLQCSISAQDCSILFSPATTLHKLPYASGSCVRDARLAGNVGRCGFPGAACVTDSLGNDNCAYGGDSTVLNYRPLCQNGVCGGGLGATCRNGDFDCNWGYYCNATAGFTGTCGGFNAFVDSQGDTGVDFAFDYCLSGKAVQSSTGSWYCTEAAGSVIAGVPSGGVSSTVPVVGGSTANGGGTTNTPVGGTSTIVGQTVTVIGSVTRTVSFTQTGTNTVFGFNPTNTSLNDGRNGNASKHHSSTGLIAGVVAGVVVIIILLIVIVILWRRSSRRNGNGNNGAPVHLPPTPQTAQFNLSANSGYVTEPLLAPHGQHAGSSLTTSPAPSSQMQQLTGSTTTTPSFPNPAAFTYLPEIQHDENAAARLSYPNTNGPPGGFGFAPSTMLQPNTPSSPAFAYAGSTGSGSGSSPPISPSPYATSYPQAQAQAGNMNAGGVPASASGLNVNMVYGSGGGGGGGKGNMDATERHLMAARMEADRELAQMRWDGRDS